MFVRPILLFFILLWPYIYSFSGDHVRVRRQPDAACVTPRGEKGVCVILRKCTSLYTSLRSYSTKNIKYIEQSLCGSKTGPSKVCCPNDSVSAARLRPKTAGLSTAGTERVNPDICGKPSTTDVQFEDENAGPSNQTLSALGNWPWMVSIRYEYFGLTGASPYRAVHKCSGVLISKQYVLTVASCLSKRIPIHSIRLGDLELTSDRDGASPIDLQAERVIFHPQYALTPRLVNNIALIRLNRSVEYTPTVRPVCLLNGPQYLTDSYYHKRHPFVVGWGDDDSKLYQLNRLKAEMINVTQCQRDFVSYPATIDQRVVCAITNDTDCKSDHFGPLFFAELNDQAEITYYLGGLGVIGFGQKCEKPGFPGVYSRIATYIDWIGKTAGLKF